MMATKKQMLRLQNAAQKPVHDVTVWRRGHHHEGLGCRSCNAKQFTAEKFWEII